MSKRPIKNYLWYMLIAILLAPNIADARSDKRTDEVLLHEGRTVYVHQDVVFHGREVSPEKILSKTMDPNTGGKERRPNTRVKNDPRPSLPKLVDSINPKNPRLPSQHVVWEILETKDYDPVWVIKHESEKGASDWFEIYYDKRRSEACKPLFRPADPKKSNSQLYRWVSFTNDPTGKKITGNTMNRLCDADTIWMWDYMIEKPRVVIIKLNLAGDIIYRISLDKSDVIKDYVNNIQKRYYGRFMPRTLKAENGYLYFELWYFATSGYDRYVKRTMKVRVKEPGITPKDTSLTMR